MMCDETVGTLTSEEGLPSAERHRAKRGLNDQAQRRLGVHLRAMYETIVQQPVPDRFKDLIARLDDPAASTEKA